MTVVGHSPAQTPNRIESEFIAVARITMIFGLVIHHMGSIPGSIYWPRDPLKEYSYLVPDFINGLVHMAFMTAVPVLSIVSGFLFFFRSNINFHDQLKKRLFTVAIPAWMWALIWFGLGFFFFKAGILNTIGWGDYNFENVNLKVFLNGVVGIDQMPYAIQFWFIHDLLITLVLTPLIFWFIKNLKEAFVFIVFLAWFFIDSPIIFFSLNVLFFFCIGSYLALNSRNIRIHALLPIINRFGLYLVALFLIALIFRLYSHKMPLQILEKLIVSGYYLKLLRLLGVLAFSYFIILACRQDAIKSFLIGISGYSFFIFASHLPMMFSIKTLAQQLIPELSGFGLFIRWLVVPLLSITICILVAYLLDRHTPGLFRILNGGRSTLPPLTKG